MKEQRELEYVVSGAVQYDDGQGFKTLTKDDFLINKRKKEKEHARNHNSMELKK